MAQILDFNAKKQQKEVEELEHDLEDADAIIDDLVDELGELFDAYGMVDRNDKIAKDFFYVMESVRSFVYGYMDIEHPFHNVIDEMVECSYNDQAEVYNVYWKERPTDEGHIQKILDLSEEID